MDRQDALFLIDQFNKYASWVHQERGFFYSSIAIATAALAVIVSLTGGANSRVDEATRIICVVVLAFMIPGLFIHRHMIKGEHDVNKEKLSVLMDHFSQYSSLPGKLTFKEVLEPLGKLKDRLGTPT